MKVKVRKMGNSELAKLKILCYKQMSHLPTVAYLGFGEKG